MATRRPNKRSRSTTTTSRRKTVPSRSRAISRSSATRPKPKPKPRGNYKTQAELDQRRHPRLLNRAKARIFREGRGRNDSELSAYIHTVDLSVGGAFIESTFMFKKGVNFQVEFEVPDLGRVLVDAEVVRLVDETADSPAGFAVKFTDFYDDSELILRAYLAGDLHDFVRHFVGHNSPKLTERKLVELVVAWEMHREQNGEA